MQRSHEVPAGVPHAADNMKMPVVQHLQELRVRLILVIISLFLGIVVGWFGQDWVIDLFYRQVGRLVYFTPAEMFFTKLRIALTLGMLITLPVLLVQAWLFVVPGLYPHEAKLVRRAAPSAYVLFLLGLGFGYFVVYPTAVHFLLDMPGQMLRPTVSVAGHFNLFAGMILPFGLVFQVPLVLYVAVRLGLVSPLVLTRRRRHVIFWSFFISAAITPPDGATLFMLAGPMVLLFELGLVLARRAARRMESEV